MAKIVKDKNDKKSAFYSFSYTFLKTVLLKDRN